MNDDVIRIVPCEDQSAEEVAEVLSQAATAQGIEDEVLVDGGEVIVPRSLMVGATPGGAPPASGTVYCLNNPIKVSGPEGADLSAMRFSELRIPLE
ncbi:hypothetical protein [Streptomyces sp. NPDC091371]|uniref:hypothetical protein n=1 Tax=Streptomyces sp. NPDC091371 TaxID=3155303 RepID=UPI00341A4EFA